MLEHFRSLGFACPRRKDPGSFLQEVSEMLSVLALPLSCATVSLSPSAPAPWHSVTKPIVGQCARCGTASESSHNVRQGGTASPWDCRCMQVTTPTGQWLYASPDLLQQHGLTGAGQPGRHCITHTVCLAALATQARRTQDIECAGH